MYVSVNIPTVNYLQMPNAIARTRKALQYVHYINKMCPNFLSALAETHIEIAPKRNLKRELPALRTSVFDVALTSKFGEVYVAVPAAEFGGQLNSLFASGCV